MLDNAPAQAQDHRAVPLHQGGEGGLVALGREALQELAVGQLRRVRRQQLAEVLGAREHVERR